MSTNETHRDANKLSAPVPAGTKSGDPLRIGGLNLVAVTDAAKTDVAPTNADGTRNTAYNAGGGNANGYASVWATGSHTFQVSFAVTSWGDPVYITSGNALSGTASGNTLYGHALNTKTGAAGPLTVRIAN